MIRKGDIYWADLNPTIGSEISKVRPVIVVSGNIGNRYSSTVTVIPITSQTQKIYPFEMLIAPDDAPVKSTSKAKANQIRTIDKTRLREKLGRLSQPKVRELDQAILIHLDITRKQADI